jgi:2-polyprenyl-6-methoxyphenol hydroxylase-like FAD-dependent oxidoreductase
MTFDRVLRTAATKRKAITFVTGNVDGLVRLGTSAKGVKVHGRTLDADLVIDASGRDSRFTRAARPTARVEDCGVAYVSRQYRLHPTATAPPMTTPFGLTLGFSGYWAVAYLHDNLLFSITFAHDGTHRPLRQLRQADVFEAAVRQVPLLSEWIDRTRCNPLTPVLPGGRVYNSYRGQLDESGRPSVLGLISVGDAVCTTTPLAGRGVALALMQARELVRTLDKYPGDIPSATADFDSWCATNIEPWFADHCYADADRMRRWSGHDVDLGRPLPSDLIVAAAEADPRLGAIVGPYVTMDALPNTLAPAQHRAREIYEGGWRPTPPAGPTLKELISMVSSAPAVA